MQKKPSSSSRRARAKPDKTERGTDRRDTTVGSVAAAALEFTAGGDLLLDPLLVEVDCIGSAAHVTTLAAPPLQPPVFSRDECRAVIDALVEVMRRARKGRFRITPEDQDVHLAVEREITARLGVLGKRMHTGRSRNDQVAVDLRLYAKQQLPLVAGDACSLADLLLRWAGQHRTTPMAGRTHLQPAMPSTVALWTGAHVESLLDDLALLTQAYELNDRCPLGAAAGYGSPLALDRRLTARLLGFRAPCANVLYAVTARGKLEAIIVAALAQTMLTLSRLAEDLILYSMPEFGYFELPAEYTTGSSIMPQKRNPDVLELIIARAARMGGDLAGIFAVVGGLPMGYRRDVQETKRPLLEGLQGCRQALLLTHAILAGTRVCRPALLRGLTPELFATDRVMELVRGGMPFRDAYHHVKHNLAELERMDAKAVLATRTSYGAPAGLDLDSLRSGIREKRSWARAELRRQQRAFSRLLGTPYPLEDC